MVSEKVGGAEGTKLDDDFRDLERVREESSCVTNRAVSQVKAVGLVLHPVHGHTAVSVTSLLMVSFDVLHGPLLVEKM